MTAILFYSFILKKIGMMKRILVVDDEYDLCEILRFNLESEGYDVDVAFSGEAALNYDLSKYSLVLLDVMMEDLSGFEVAKVLRADEKTSSLPIIFLTACTSEDDILLGFDVGADDYIKKPFSVREVLARIKSLLNRIEHQQRQEKNVITCGELIIELNSKTVQLDKKEISFTKKEFGILRLLLEHPNRMFSRDEILSLIWTDEVCVLDRTVDVNIARIRKKIGRYGKNIISRSGFGYLFNA